VYTPTLARFQSRDPLTASSVDLLYPPPVIDPYRYVGNNPVSHIDPSGMAAEVCCECDELWRQLRGESDYQYDFHLISAGKNTCRVNVSCEPTKSCDGHPGRTYPPKTVANNPLYNQEINVCISCRYKPTDLVFYHELVHARQYCNNPKLDLTNCQRCKDAEEEAHKVNCRMAFPNDDAKYDHCWHCGVLISCQDVKGCAPARHPVTKAILYKGKPCDEVKDLGGTAPWTPEPPE